MYRACKSTKYDVVMVDDPWVPEASTWLIDLNESRGDLWSLLTSQGYNVESVDGLFRDVFLPVLRQASEYHDRLSGLPLVGNVQLLFYRADSVDWQGIPPDRGIGGLQRLIRWRQARTKRRVGGPPFSARYETPNDAVEVFWDVLRTLGY